MFRQKCPRLSVPPNRVVKIVESASRMSPPRVAVRRHPEERIELPIPRGGERMRPGQVDRLPGQNMNGLRILCRQRVVRQVQMEVERGHSIQQTQLVEVLVDGQGRDLIGPLHDGRPEPELVEHGHVESLHQRARVLAEALLARHELVAVMLVLHLALLHVAR